jgi:hypothetical protein
VAGESPLSSPLSPAHQSPAHHDQRHLQPNDVGISEHAYQEARRNALNHQRGKHKKIEGDNYLLEWHASYGDASDNYLKEWRAKYGDAISKYGVSGGVSKDDIFSFANYSKDDNFSEDEDSNSRRRETNSLKDSNSKPISAKRLKDRAKRAALQKREEGALMREERAWLREGEVEKRFAACVAKEKEVS